MTEQEWTDFLARTEGHTPGPWVVCEDACGDTFISGADYQYVADMAWRDEELSCDSANAAFIAAAPTLKDEVTRLREALKEIGAVTDCPITYCLCSQALKGGE